MVKNQRGALQVPLLIALVVICIACFGSWGLMRHWRQQVALQLRLDRCAGEAAMDLKRSLGRIENTNRAIVALRATVVPGTLVGLGVEAKIALEAAVAYQELELKRWQAKRALWIFRRGCGKWGDIAMPLPSMSWRRLPPDPIGPQKLTWDPTESRRLRVRVMHNPRKAAAVVKPKEGNEGEALLGINRWEAEWTSFN